MNKKYNLDLAVAVLIAVLVAQAAPAQLITNTVRNTKGMGVKVVWAGPTYSQTYDKAYTRSQAADAGKAWIQFDLSGAWATYGQANLASATLTLWGENGTSRQFNVSGLADNAGLENWVMNSLSWTNAPGNNTADGIAFDWTKAFGGAALWTTNGGGVDLGTNYNLIPDLNFDQCARYTSPDIRAFLAADTDGKVTFMWSGSNNQNWWIGTNGTYANDAGSGYTNKTGPNAGELVRQSPTLTLVFTNSPVAISVPAFTNIMQAGTNLILQGANGPTYGAYEMLRNPDLTAPMDNWEAIGAQNFDASGRFSFTSAMPATGPVNYYRLHVIYSGPPSPPVITSQPQNLALGIGESAVFNVTANGTIPMTYRWYFNTNTPLASGPDASVIIANAQLTNAGKYSVTVSNILGTTNSIFATLTVTNTALPPYIISSPSNTTVTVGQTAVFNVAVGGALPLRYQWYFNTNTFLAGQTNLALTLTNVQLTNAGEYSVTVTNLFGSTNSVFAALIVSNISSSQLIGWAAVAGYGQTTTTGGGDATPQLVTDLATLRTLAGDGIPRVLVLSGTFVTGSTPITIANNKTLRGVDQNVVIQGGIDINTKSNIIVQNMAIKGSGWTKTVVNGVTNYSQTFPVDTAAARASHHLWFDHVSFSDASDGNLDLTVGSDYITVSWCKFYYTPGTNDVHRLCSLVGNGSTATTDTNKNNVTYHHNWFSTLVDQRMPRLLFGKGHMFNNYYFAPGNGYCIGTGSWGSALVENNYFKQVKSPHQYQDTNPSYIAASGNIYDNCTGNTSTGLGYPLNDGKDPGPWTPTYPYTLDPAANVPSIVTQGAGPQ